MPDCLIVAPSAYPLGGLATWLDMLIPGLTQAGWNVRLGLVAGRWHDTTRYLREHEQLPVREVRNRTGTREGRVRSLARVIAAERPDLLVVVNIPDAYDAVARLRKRKMPGLRTVMAVHAIESDYFAELRELQAVVDAVVCANRLACRLAEVGSGFPRERVFYAPGGVEMPPWRGPRPAGERLEILWAGRLDERTKRVSDLPRIVTALAPNGIKIGLTIAGDGPDEEAARQSLATVPPFAAVRFLGRVSQADLTTRILPAHDLLLVTSPRETGPLVAWEAMAAGVVVVSSRYLGSGLEGALVDQRNSRLFEVGDSGAAARCIAELAEPGARAELALAARRMIESRYRRELSVAAWQAAFAAALATPPREMATVIPRRGQTAGRLDRWFGIGFAENLREWLGREFVHSSPGGEWPHSYGNWGDETEFLALARRLDRDEAAA